MANRLENEMIERVFKEGTFDNLKSLIHDRDLVTALPVLVQFKKSIFEDDFIEAGMKAEIVGIEEKNIHGDKEIELFFYFSDELYPHNRKFFRRCYYGREALGQKRHEMFTAEEVNMYKQNYSISVMDNTRIAEYLILIPN